jgi:hypothetical protein
VTLGRSSPTAQRWRSLSGAPMAFCRELAAAEAIEVEEWSERTLICAL